MTQEMDDAGRRDREQTKFLAEVVKRAPLFEALRDDPANARQLESSLSMSRSTIHRTMQSFDEWGLVRKRDGEFELTGLGEMIAGRLSTFDAHVEAACRLESFLNTVEPTDVEIPVQHFEDATVTRPRARQAHFGVKRILELIEDSESLRLFTSIISPVYVDVAHREMLNGTDIQAIFDAELVDIIVEEYRGEASEALASGRFDVLVYDGVPFELFLFDDVVGMAAHDDDGIPRAFVETDDPDARAWAERLYERHLADASPIRIGD